MSEKTAIEPSAQTSKNSALIAGVILGALVGLGAAFLFVQRAERNAEPIKVSTGEGIKLGVLVFGLLRSIAQLGEEK